MEKSVADMVSIMNKNQEDFKDSGIDKWDDYVESIKKKQAYDKLKELGYYHDSGLYGWLKTK